MSSTNENSIIWAIVLLIEALILTFAKSMRLWIYIALPIIAGFAAMELLKRKPITSIIMPRPIPTKRMLR